MTTRRSLILGGVAILGFLYATLWALVNHQVFMLFCSFEGAPSSPEALAKMFPLVSGAAWLHRIDLFGGNSLDPSLFPSELMHHYSVRHVCLGLAVAATPLLFLLQRPFTRRWRCVLARSGQALLLVCTILALVLATLSFATYQRRYPKWDRQRDPNILNYHSRYEGMNEDIEVPPSGKGVLLTRDDTDEIHLEMDRRGWFSISGVPLTREQMVAILERRASRCGVPRILLWVDFRCPSRARDELLEIAMLVTDEIYYVVYKGSTPFPDYRAVHHSTPPEFPSPRNP